MLTQIKIKKMNKVPEKNIPFRKGKRARPPAFLYLFQPADMSIE
jgi:hypothetical protein